MMATDLERLQVSAVDAEQICVRLRELTFAIQRAGIRGADDGTLNSKVQSLRDSLQSFLTNGGESVEEEIVRPACVGHFKPLLVAGIPAVTAWQAAEYAACSLTDDWKLFPGRIDVMVASAATTPEPMQLLVDVQRETAAGRLWLTTKSAAAAVRHIASKTVEHKSLESFSPQLVVDVRAAIRTCGVDAPPKMIQQELRNIRSTGIRNKTLLAILNCLKNAGEYAGKREYSGNDSRG